MENITAVTSQKIKNMSIVSALLVVTIHVSFPESGASWVVKRIVSDGVARIAVPYFFIVSGFFLAGHFDDNDWYKKELRKRVRSLLVPYLIWLFTATCLTLPLSIIAVLVAHRPFGTSPYFSNGRWLASAGLDLRQGPSSLGALWYVRCLLMFVVLSPLFKLLVRRLGVIWLMVAFALTLVHKSTLGAHPSDLHKIFEFGISLSGVFYFSFGIWLRSHYTDLYVARGWKILCMAISVLLLFFESFFLYHKTPVSVHLMTVAIPFMLLSVWTVIPTNKWPAWFTGSSFPLFLMHLPLIAYLKVPIKYTVLAGSFVGEVLVMAGAIVASFLITVFLNKHYPKVSQVLFAGRT